MSGYGAKSSNLNEGAALGVGIHKNIFLKSIDKTVNTEGKQWESIDFRFENNKKDYYLYRLFNPDGGDDIDKVIKGQRTLSDKVVYIVSKINDKEAELPSVNSFDELVEAVKGMIAVNFNEVPLEIKLIGNVYLGKGYIQAPNLVNGGFIGGGWIRREDKGDPLTLTPQNIKANAEYLSFIQNTSKTESNDYLGSEDNGTEEMVF